MLFARYSVMTEYRISLKKSKESAGALLHLKISIISSFLVFFYLPILVYTQPRIINGVSIPNDFPELIVNINNNPSPGNIFTSNTSGNAYYVMIFNNDGTPYYYKKVNHYSTDFKVQPNGKLSRYSYDDDGFILIGNNFETEDIFSAKNGYETDEHEFVVTPNGTFLMICITSEIRDLSSVVSGGSTNATLIGNVIQEQDADHNVIFEWNSFDHFNITDALGTNLTESRIDWVHMNSLAIDYDGNLLVSSRHLSECTKINMQTGEIIWRLGGNNNEFDFINEDIPISFQHAFYPVEGKPGHYTIYDNGNNRGQFSRVVEYKITIDGQTKTAEKVWEFRTDPDFYAHRAGTAQRLANGNTFINLEQPQYPKAVEVTPNGEIVYQANFSPITEAHKAFRFEWSGQMETPYLLIEPLSGAVRLIFNQFGDEEISNYKIYGGSYENDMSFILETDETWADIDLRSYSEFDKYYFKVTSVDAQLNESGYSNFAEVQLTNLFSGSSTGILGVTNNIDISDPQWTNSQPGFGSALSFDGIDDYVQCGNDNSLQITGNAITLEAWIKPQAFKTNAYDGVIISKKSFLLDDFAGYSLSCGDEGTLYFSIGNQELYEASSTAGVIPLNEWTHVAAVFNGTALQIYINANLVVDQPIETNRIGNASTRNLTIGSSSFYGNRNFSGTIDEVRVWNTARKQTEIQELMDIEISQDIYSNSLNGLIGYWQFNEGEGQYTEDLATDNNQILNGDFSQNDNYWELIVSNGVTTVGTIDNIGRYFLDITDGGPSFANIQLSQQNIWLLKDYKYKLEFEAQVNTSKIIGIDFRNPETPWIDYAMFGLLNIVTTNTHYKIEFIMNENSDNRVELVFLLGGNEKNIYLDNVRLTSDIASSISEDYLFQNNFELFNNYPNPFNPSTTIEYYLPEKSNVTISVYNILGQLVQTILDEQQTAGKQKIIFNGSSLSSGAYFYTLLAKSILTNRMFFDANKMILIK